MKVFLLRATLHFSMASNLERKINMFRVSFQRYSHCESFFNGSRLAMGQPGFRTTEDYFTVHFTDEVRNDMFHLLY